ncbi:outer membrane beta-barrel protein [Shimia sp. Alg240-R146]|uniref:outer membrane beta-barrel protein n=1 Tax=Shimia sp. Alg240-R146 TaxID=2993449 RepID=UPI0022E0CD21|nr:outer membrane beta-barrel protein [Shimia sp. Alg240-R146]
MLYGTVGAVRGNLDTGAGSVSDNGVAYGIDVERAIASNWTVGFEIQQSEYSNINGGSNLKDTAATLRVNSRF